MLNQINKKLKEMYIYHLSKIYILIIFMDIRKKQKANPM